MVPKRKVAAIIVILWLVSAAAAAERRLTVNEAWDVVQDALPAAGSLDEVQEEFDKSQHPDNAQTLERRKKIDTVRRAVGTWEITEADRSYLMAALAVQERVVVYHSRGLARVGRDRSPAARADRAKLTAVLRRLERELLPPFVDFRGPLTVGSVGYLCWPKFKVAQVIDEDTFHGYLPDDFQRLFRLSRGRIVFDDFPEVGDHADGQDIQLSKQLIVEVAKPDRYATVVGGTATVPIVRPLKVSSDLPQLIERVERWLKNPAAAQRREAVAE